MRNNLQLLVLSVLAGALLSGCGGGGTPQAPGNNGTGNPLPSVTSLSPASATTGGAAFTLTVTGTNFVSGSVVNWAGVALTTTFVSATNLTAAVPASELSATGAVDVIVTNPTPGGGSSVAKTFNINNPAPAVTSLSQTSTNVGSGDFTLTLTGSGFVSTSVMNWNGSARNTTFGSATSLTASITAADITIAGSAHVSVSNPTPGGGNSSNLTFTITPHIANGNALSGDPNSAAVDATSDVPAVGVDDSQVQDGVIMSRLDVRFAKDATVGQVNDAFASIGAGVVSMSKGFTSLTIGIPPQNSFDALNALVAQLEASPGIAFAGIGYVPQTRRFFPSPGSNGNGEQAIVHLLPERFPAAWNLLRPEIVGDPSNDTVLRSCPFASVPVLITDSFATPPPSDLLARIPSAVGPDVDADPALASSHGYSVAETLANTAFGANPFAYSGCVDVQLVQFALNLTQNQLIDNFVAHMPASERFIVSRSFGYPDQCRTSGCVPPRDLIDRPLARANDTLYWKEKTFDRWSNFLIVVASGNERRLEATSIYPALGDSRFDDWANIGQLADTQFSFVNDDSLWTPNAASSAKGFLSLKPTAAEQTSLAQSVAAALQAGQAVADNVIVVGAATNEPRNQALVQHFTGDQLTEAPFSDSGPDVLAVGVDVNGLDGSSFATPQVSGLASYLWMLSPDLRNFQPISATKNAIVANTRNKVIDAYASALSLDGAITPQTAPMRVALLDVNGNGRFDDTDIDQILRKFFIVDGTGAITHDGVIPASGADFSRFDLNGDGFTTALSQLGGAGTLRERFDLDRVGSTQYGATQYSTISETIEGQQIQFDENAVTDLEVLCYYAYSPLYQGDINARKTLLDGRCGLAVTPATVTVVAGQTQQFTANTPNNDPVTWSATCGTIDANGLYTATSLGFCTVRATDTKDSTLTGTATVTVDDSRLLDAEFGFSAELKGFDQNGNAVFPDQLGRASDTGTLDPAPPYSFTSSGPFQANPNVPKVNYQTQVIAEGPTTNAASGTFNGTVSCSASGTATTDENDQKIFPIMPTLDASTGGSFSVSAPPEGLSFAVSGAMARGQITGNGNFAGQKLNGHVTVQWVDAGGATQQAEFRLNDGTTFQGTPSASTVNMDAGGHISPPGFVNFSWSLEAECIQPGVDNGVDSKRSGSIVMSFSIAH